MNIKMYATASGIFVAQYDYAHPGSYHGMNEITRIHPDGTKEFHREDWDDIYADCEF